MKGSLDYTSGNQTGNLMIELHSDIVFYVSMTSPSVWTVRWAVTCGSNPRH